MCKLLRRTIKSMTSTSLRPHNCGDDASRRYRDVAPASGPRPSLESTKSPVAPTPEPPSARGTTYPTSHIRSEKAPTRSLSDPKTAHDTQERVDVDQDSAEHRKRSATSIKDYGPPYPREGEATKVRNELRPYRDEDRYQYSGDHIDDRQDSGMHHPSLKENVDVSRPPLSHAKDMEPISPSSANIQYLCEAQSRELSILQHERRATLEAKRSLANAYASLKQQYEERSKRLNAVRHERQAALVEKKELDDAYAALRRQYEEQSKELSVMRHERQAALEQKRKVDEDYSSLRQEYETHNVEYNTLRNKYLSLKATLEQRTSELQGVQRFLTTADTFSGSEVVNALRTLNEEVQQSAAFMAEWAVESFKFETPPADKTTKQTRTSEALAMRLMQMLGTRNHKDNPILIEMAFRAYLIYELYWVASPWSVGQEEQSHNMYIDTIYQRMRDTEGQAVSGNWRALTRTYTLPACISDPELARTIDTTIISGFSDILLAAGCMTPDTDITSIFWSKFAERVHHFVLLAGQISKIIGVGVISEDFEVLVASPDAVFDDKTMEDSYDNGDRNRGGHKETVLCATELGLMQRMKMKAGAGQEGKQSELVVVKPKVALVSVINMIDE